MHRHTTAYNPRAHRKRMDVRAGQLAKDRTCPRIRPTGPFGFLPHRHGAPSSNTPLEKYIKPTSAGD